MKNAFLFTLALFVIAAGSAANAQSAEEVFQRYWSAFSKKDFAKAAAEVLPSDLEDAKKELLPVFLSAQTHKDKQIQEMVGAFFGRIVGKSRETMSPVEIYAGLNRVVTAGNPEMFETLKEAALTIVFVRTMDADNVEIHYQLMLRGESDMDIDALTRKNGRWWVRISEDPKEIAANFKALLERQK